VTDLPRKAYPLVVAPPGGFEDAVRRGRRRRRQRTGGSTGAALALVGVLAYAVMGHQSGGADRLDTTQRPNVEQTAPAPVIGGDAITTVTGPKSTTPSGGTTKPRTGANPVAGPSAHPGAGPVQAPSAAPPAQVTKPSARPQPTLHYAARPPITHTGASTNTDIECLPRQNEDWCTKASVDNTTDDQVYTLFLAICRGIGSGDADLHFSRKQEADYVAIEQATNDPVWTYSAGQPVVRKAETVGVPAGECVVWETNWNGLDDFGRLPPPGKYTLRASSFATEPLPAAEFVFDHQ
jgi:hypothetical protein